MRKPSNNDNTAYSKTAWKQRKFKFYFLDVKVVLVAQYEQQASKFRVFVDGGCQSQGI